MQEINQAKFLLVIFLLPLFLTGCYDRFELDNLAYVIALGADVGSGDNLNITYQVAIPIKITGESSEGRKYNIYNLYCICPFPQCWKYISQHKN